VPPTGVDAQTGSGAGQIVLSWNAVMGATGYKIYYDEDSSNPPFSPSDNGNPVSGSAVGNVTQVTISDLTPGQAYYCAVVAYNSTGDSDYSSQDSATAGDNLPQPATNPSPTNGAIGQSINTDISWSNGGGATSYDVYFGTDSTPDSGEFKGNQTGTSYDPGTLNYNTTYYWRIDAKNSTGTTTGYVWHFTTAETPSMGLSFSGYRVDDDSSGQSSGNNNGVIDPGETIELYVTLKNTESADATGVSAEFSTSDPYVGAFLYNTSSSYPDIPYGGTGENTDDFDFPVDPSCPVGHVITFDLAITSNEGYWTDSFKIVVGRSPAIMPWLQLLLLGD